MSPDNAPQDHGQPQQPAEQPPPTEQLLALEKQKTETLRELIKTGGEVADKLIAAFARQDTTQTKLAWLGGISVLGVGLVAGLSGRWELTEKLALPVLAFFSGLLAGAKKN